jgi:hypothetical protein
MGPAVTGVTLEVAGVCSSLVRVFRRPMGGHSRIGRGSIPHRPLPIPRRCG